MKHKGEYMKTTTTKCDLCNKIIPIGDNSYDIKTISHSTYITKTYSDVCLDCYFKINSLIEKLRRPHENK